MSEQRRDLIQNLSHSLKPVKVVKFRKSHYCAAILVSILAFVCGLFISGLRNNFKEVLLTPTFILQCFFLLIIAFRSMRHALILSIPGLHKERNSRVVLSLCLSWVVLLISLFVLDSEKEHVWGIGCATEIFLNSLIPAMVLIYFARSGAPLFRGRVGWSILAAGSAFGALVSHFSCSELTPLHLLFWHATPMLLIGALGYFLGFIFLKKV